MDDWIEINKDDAHIKRERAKARELRKTAHFQELFRKGICYYCKAQFPADELTIDHIVPLARGGRSTKEIWSYVAKNATTTKNTSPRQR